MSAKAGDVEPRNQRTRDEQENESYDNTYGIGVVLWDRTYRGHVWRLMSEVNDVISEALITLVPCFIRINDNVETVGRICWIDSTLMF